MLGVFGVDLDSSKTSGDVTVTVSADGLKSASLAVKVGDGSADAWWCPKYPEL